MTALVLLNELMFRRSFWAILVWMAQNPFLFLLNLTFLLTLTTLLFLFCKRLHIAVWLVFIVGVGLGVANANKFSMRSIPFSVRDILLLQEVWVLLPKLVNLKSLIMLGLSLPIVFLAYRFFRWWFGTISLADFKVPAIAAALASLFLLSIGQLAYTSDLDAWDIGFIYSLSNGIRPAAKYENQTILPKVAEFINSDLPDRPLVNKREQRPNVIIIMSESFWDITRLNVGFSQNPLAFFQSLRSRSLHGELYVPVFGGGTANTEYEVLTGLSLKTYAHDWHVVYRNEIHQTQESLASIFKGAGYKTVALHPYHPWYYRRHEVYPLLGFDSFISIDDMPGAPTLGSFVSDAYLTERLIELLEQTAEPVFNFTVTMQNHGPYENNPFPATVELTTQLPPASTDRLARYATGLQYSDQALASLVDYLTDFEEPTVVFFFGDHLPMLGADFETYRDSGYIDDETAGDLNDDLRMRTVPWLLWTNYRVQSAALPAMNASFAGPLILEAAGLAKPAKFLAVEALAEAAPLILRDFYIDGTGQRHPTESQAYQEILATYHTVFERFFNQTPPLLPLTAWPAN